MEAPGRFPITTSTEKWQVREREPERDSASYGAAGFKICF
jgi:hypothetical protein